ncbi:MAG: SRPBCC family protein [Flavobacteriaceae bacterium]
MPKMNVNKSILIDAAPEKIFPIINDLNNWEQWSPWVLAEPTATINVAKDGKYHDWNGNIIGSGNLKIESEVENQSVVMQLQFLKPWKSKALTKFHLKKTKKARGVMRY